MRIVLIDVVRDFVALSAGGDVRGEALKRAKALMVELRRHGFSGPEISALSGVYWSDSAVRVYTMGWGGVSDFMEKNYLMGLLRSFASSKRTIVDLEWIKLLDVSAKSKGSSVEEVAELDGCLEPLGLKRGEVGRLVQVSRELMAWGLPPVAVRAWMDLDMQLEKEGFTEPVRKLLLKNCRKYGGVRKVLEAVDGYGSFAEIDQMKNEAQIKFDEIVKLAMMEGEKYKKYQNQIQSLSLCIAAGWSLSSICAAPNVLKLADTPEKQKLLFDHLMQLGWDKSDEGAQATRLVKVEKAVTLSSVEAATFLRELIDESNVHNSLDYDKMVNFLKQWKEKFPGITLSDFADQLLKGPNVSEQERKFADWLLQQEDMAKQMAPSLVPT